MTQAGAFRGTAEAALSLAKAAEAELVISGRMNVDTLLWPPSAVDWRPSLLGCQG